MSKDVDRAFLSSISDSLGPVGDIYGICAIISVFIMRRGYFPYIHIDSRANDDGRAILENPGERAITVWHHKGVYALCRGISTKSWYAVESEARVTVFYPSEGYTGLFDFLDKVFPRQENEGEDYFSKLLSTGEALEIRKVEALEDIAESLRLRSLSFERV